MGAGAAPRRRDRRLRAAHARRLPPLGPHRRRLRARAGRRTSRATGGPGPSGAPGGPGDVVILHYALPSPLQRGPARASRPPRAAPPQHHAARILRRLRPRDGRTSARSGSASSRALAGHVDLALGDSEFNRRELEEAGFRAHGRPADLPGLRALPRDAQPGAAPPPRRRPHQRAVRGAHRAQQAPGGPRPPGLVLEEVHRSRRAPAAGGQAAAAAPLLRRPPGARVRGGLHAVGGRCCPGTSTHDDLLAYYAAAHVFVSPERARGLRRAARRVDADGRAGRGAPRDRGRRHPRRRGRAVRGEAHRRDGGGRRIASRPTRPLRAGVLGGQRRRVRDFAPAAVEATLRGTWSRCEARRLALVVQRYGAGRDGRLGVARARAGRAAGRGVRASPSSPPAPATT